MATSFSQYQRAELGFDLDSFGKPIAYSGIEAWTRQIVQLCLLDHGNIPSNPTIGIGMRKYDFLIGDDRTKLQTEINRQVPLFYPDMPFVNCTVQLPGDTDDNDIVYFLISFTVSGSVETVVVAVKTSASYIDYAISI